MIPRKKVLRCLSTTLLFLVLFSNSSSASEKEEQEIIDKGVSAYENGSYDKSVRYFKEGVVKYSSSSAMLNLGIIYDKELHFYSKAKYYYNKFLRAEPEAAEVLIVKSRINAISKKNKDSLEMPSFVHSTSGTQMPLILKKEGLDEYTVRGNDYFKNNDWGNAVIEYRKAIFLKKSGTACFNLALLYYGYLNFHDKALYFFKRYLTLGKDKQISNIVSNIIEIMKKGKRYGKQRKVLSLNLRKKAK